jgi:hypothetical protein
MKLKEYLYYLIASEPVTIADAEVVEQLNRRWFDGVTTFADKTLIPKEVLDLEVRKFGGDTYFPGNFCSEEEEWLYDSYEDWYGCVEFYVEGYQKVKERLKLKEIVK